VSSCAEESRMYGTGSATACAAADWIKAWSRTTLSERGNATGVILVVYHTLVKPSRFSRFMRVGVYGFEPWASGSYSLDRPQT
jgi:hypothetical protein